MINQEYLNRDIDKVAIILEAQYDKSENNNHTFIRKYILSNGALVTTTWKLTNHDLHNLIFSTENKWRATTVIDSPDEAKHRITMKGKTTITEVMNCEDKK